MFDIQITVPNSRVKDILSTAVEGGVNYWCRISSEHRLPYDFDYYKEDWLLKITDTESGNDEVYEMRISNLKNGLQLFQKDYPERFNSFITDYYDAEDADVFFQLCLFGKVIYG